MIQAALDIVGWVGLVGGGAFVIIGALGLVRLPDVYSRMHAAGITDTLGAWLMLVGMMAQSPDWLTAVKLFLIIVLIFFTSPTSTYAVANAAYGGGVEPVGRDGEGASSNS